jgi:hypothetical protein
VKGADAVVSGLRDAAVFCDSRGDIVRFGPAPYVTDAEIDTALHAFRRLVP